MQKTIVVRQLGEFFSGFVEINFEESPDLGSFFDRNLNPDEIISNLQKFLNVSIENGKTLLFFDEIQACSRALLSLRHFFEKRPELHVIAAGSLIDFELESISF
ncbi:MAG: ATP-binding protein, partial [Spirochaetes bacterium]